MPETRSRKPTGPPRDGEVVRWAPEDAPRPATGDDELPPEADREYRRPARRARVRRGLAAALALRAARLARSSWPLLAVLLVIFFAYRFLATDPAFTLDGSAGIAVAGARHVTAARVDQVFAADFGRNIYFIPLQERADMLLQIPWVRRASVLRLWPNRLRVEIEERVPVAFARAGSRLDLVDADGVLLERPPRAHYDFPVLAGLAGTPGGAGSGADARRAQVGRFLDFERALAAGGISAAPISEVHLGDPDDLAAVVAGGSGAAILLHLGDGEYLARYKLYLAHIGEWRRNFPRLRSVDLRYDGQAILDSAPSAAAPAAAPKRAAARRRGKARPRRR